MATTGRIGKGVSKGDGKKNGYNKNDNPKSEKRRTNREGGRTDTFLENALKTHTMEISKLSYNMYVQNIL